MKKQLLLIFGLGFLLAVIFLLLMAIKTRQEMRKAALTINSELSLITAQGTSIDIGDQFSVGVALNTQGQNVYAVDAVIEFDNTILRLTPAGPVSSGIEPTYTHFQTFVPWNDQNDFNETGVVAEANSSGRIEFGAVVFDQAAAEANPDTYDPYNYPVNGLNIQLATLYFEVVDSGDGLAEINFVDNGGTTDSNVVHVCRADDPACPIEEYGDILAATHGLAFNVSGVSCPCKDCGDSYCDGEVTFNDFYLFRDEFRGNDLAGVDANYDGSADGVVDMVDFYLLRDGIRCETRCADKGCCQP